MQIPFAFIRNLSSYVHKVSGVDGDVVISSNTSIPAGSVKQYNSLTINPGVTLTITGTGITEIGVRNNFVNNGRLIFQENRVAGNSSKVSAISGESLTFNQVQSSGGSGGKGGEGALAAVDGGAGIGGSQNSGNGGGGGGGGGGTADSVIIRGGNGGSGTAGTDGSYTTGASSGRGLGGSVSGSVTSGGNPVRAKSGKGGTGASGGGGGAYNNSKLAYVGGGGGGGGLRGLHGGRLYLYVEGAITGSGDIYCQGTNGGAGGNGGINVGSETNTYRVAGGGGGGGSGGSGGVLRIRWRLGVAPWYIAAGPGAGGAGGSGGAGTNTYGQSANGSPGTVGGDGIVDIVQIT